MCPAMLAYQVCECTRSAPAMSGTIRRSTPRVCTAAFAPAEVLGHGVGRDRRTVVPRLTGRAEGAHLQIHMLGQHPAEFGHVDPGAAIDFGREFFGHNVYTHKPQGSRYGGTDLV